MIREERLWGLLEQLPEEMLARALTVDKKMKRRRSARWGLMAASICIALLSVTPSGRVFASELVEKVVEIVKEFFQPKDVTLNLEGMEEQITYDPQIVPDNTTSVVEESSAEADNLPGYVIWIDTERYEMVQEEDAAVIRPVGEWPETLPQCDMRIEELTVSMEEAAQLVQEELSAEWANVGEWEPYEKLMGTIIYADDGEYQWNSLCQAVVLTDNGKGGAYKITLRWFMEATEGHFGRFMSMLETFTLMKSE